MRHVLSSMYLFSVAGDMRSIFFMFRKIQPA